MSIRRYLWLSRDNDYRATLFRLEESSQYSYAETETEESDKNNVAKISRTKNSGVLI
jgi:hypothetical protein